MPSSKITIHSGNSEQFRAMLTLLNPIDHSITLNLNKHIRIHESTKNNHHSSTSKPAPILLIQDFGECFRYSCAIFLSLYEHLGANDIFCPSSSKCLYGFDDLLERDEGLGFCVARMEDSRAGGIGGRVNGCGARDENEGTTAHGAVVADLCFPWRVGPMILFLGNSWTWCGLGRHDGVFNGVGPAAGSAVLIVPRSMDFAM